MQYSKHLEKRLRNLETSIASNRTINYDILRENIEEIVYDQVNEAIKPAKNLLSTSDFAGAVSDTIAQELNVSDCGELREMTEFVRLQMKMAKAAPETSRDILREHEVETGL